MPKYNIKNKYKYKKYRSRVHKRISRRKKMKGGSNNWICSRKSSKYNKLYETLKPNVNIQNSLNTYYTNNQDNKNRSRFETTRRSARTPIYYENKQQPSGPSTRKKYSKNPEPQLGAPSDIEYTESFPRLIKQGSKKQPLSKKPKSILQKNQTKKNTRQLIESEFGRRRSRIVKGQGIPSRVPTDGSSSSTQPWSYKQYSQNPRSSN